MTAMEIRRELRQARLAQGVTAIHLGIELGVIAHSVRYLERDAKFVDRLVDWAAMVGCEIVVRRKAKTKAGGAR